jgi:hypothetical protein
MNAEGATSRPRRPPRDRALTDSDGMLGTMVAGMGALVLARSGGSP